MLTIEVPPDHRAAWVPIVRVTVHTMGGVLPGAHISQNHWSIFLVTPPESVRVNMVQPPEQVDSLLHIKHLNFEHSHSAVVEWDFPTAPFVTVDRVISLLLGLRRERYQMTETGVGCRFWV